MNRPPTSTPASSSARFPRPPRQPRQVQNFPSTSLAALSQQLAHSQALPHHPQQHIPQPQNLQHPDPHLHHSQPQHQFHTFTFPHQQQAQQQAQPQTQTQQPQHPHHPSVQQHPSQSHHHAHQQQPQPPTQHIPGPDTSQNPAPQGQGQIFLPEASSALDILLPEQTGIWYNPSHNPPLSHPPHSHALRSPHYPLPSVEVAPQQNTLAPQAAPTRHARPPLPPPSGNPPTATGPGAVADDDNSLIEKYVALAAQSADSAKIRYRNELKTEQRRRELDARERGEPLSARDKERERSRRESSVTRRRAEVYVAQLETTARRLPPLEQEIIHLKNEISALRAALHAQGVSQAPSPNDGGGGGSSNTVPRDGVHGRSDEGTVGLSAPRDDSVPQGGGAPVGGPTPEESMMVEGGTTGNTLPPVSAVDVIKHEDDAVVVASPGRRSSKIGTALRPVEM